MSRAKTAPGKVSAVAPRLVALLVFPLAGTLCGFQPPRPAPSASGVPSGAQSGAQSGAPSGAAHDDGGYLSQTQGAHPRPQTYDAATHRDAATGGTGTQAQGGTEPGTETSAESGVSPGSGTADSSARPSGVAKGILDTPSGLLLAISLGINALAAGLLFWAYKLAQARRGGSVRGQAASGAPRQLRELEAGVTDAATRLRELGRQRDTAEQLSEKTEQQLGETEQQLVTLRHAHAALQREYAALQAPYGNPAERQGIERPQTTARVPPTTATAVVDPIPIPIRESLRSAEPTRGSRETARDELPIAPAIRTNDPSPQTSPYALPDPALPDPAPPAPAPPALGTDPLRDYLAARHAADPGFQAAFKEFYAPVPVACTNLAQRGVQGVRLVFQGDARSSLFCITASDNRAFLFPQFAVDPAFARGTLEGTYLYPAEFTDLTIERAASAERKGDTWFLLEPGQLRGV